ncbi:uncharacterized protein LOC129925172 [Biomphalaria glabrata]|uniref:Uncharacterized protein LOC129925172 n=1 Tax=Biomphalaria glabrata TaxID=6526 RepID=A0A9W2ZY11_BIOGL|nr:uncharacterized protein LOC129925172 [Biomphalaria glabrata]
MKTWINLGLIKKKVNKKCKYRYVYVLKKGKPIRKRSFFKNSHPIVIKDFLDRKQKNPLTQKINFLHGLKQVLNMAVKYCTDFIIPEVGEYCGTDGDLQRLSHEVVSHKIHLDTLDTLVETIHDIGYKDKEIFRCFTAADFLNDHNILSCPCRNPIYFHYYKKMEKCLTQDNVAFSSQGLRNKRTFFLTLQKCVHSLSVRNPKQYS